MSAPKSDIHLSIDKNELKTRLSSVRAWLFDWDGIFNNGHKSHLGHNTFSERDSMGTNMLRYAHYLRTGHQPFCGIITGATNETPKFFAKREHFHAVVGGALYKRDVVELLLKRWGVKPNEAAFVFDDILDLNVCEIVGLRVQVKYEASSLFNNYIEKNKYCDVAVKRSGSDQAVRCLTEFFINLNDQLEETIIGRMKVSESYQQYFQSRQQIQTTFASRAELLAL